MKLLFLTPPMANWLRWGAKHIACNPLHAHVAAYVRGQRVAKVTVLDCRAMAIDVQSMLDRIRQESPDAIFVGTRLVTDGGATPLVRFIEVFELLKQSFPQITTSCRCRPMIFFRWTGTSVFRASSITTR